MPCYDSRDDDDRRLTKERLDKATRVACELAKLIEAYKCASFGVVYPLSREAQEWVDEHNRLDDERKRKYKAKRKNGNRLLRIDEI